MELEKREKELLIRAFTFYYENYVFKDLKEEDNSKASAEDYNIRDLTNKLGIRDMFSDEIKQSW